MPVPREHFEKFGGPFSNRGPLPLYIVKDPSMNFLVDPSYVFDRIPADIPLGNPLAVSRATHVYHVD
jgi:hypothetical protein